MTTSKFNQQDRSAMRRVGVAAGASVALVALVAALLQLQAPEGGAGLPSDPTTGGLPASPIDIPPISPVDGEVQADRAEAATGLKQPQAEQGAGRQAETEPSSPDRPPEASQPVLSPPPSSPDLPEHSTAESLATRSYDAGSFKVKFTSVDDLVGLIEDGHVELIVEFSDGRRFRLPRLVAGASVTLPVTEAEFSSWVSEGRVSELVASAELQRQVNLHSPGMRYLAVLENSLRDSLLVEAQRARVDPLRSVLTISRGPAVRVVLARR